METEPQDSENDLGTVRKSGGGFVRDRGEHSLPSVILSVTLSPRRGRTHDALAECPSVCIPPAEDFVTSAAQNQRGEGVSVISHSVLAEQTLVSRSAGNTNGSPVADSTDLLGIYCLRQTARYGTPIPNGGKFMCGSCAGTGKPGLVVSLHGGHDYGGASPFYKTPVRL